MYKMKRKTTEIDSKEKASGRAGGRGEIRERDTDDLRRGARPEGAKRT